MINDKKLIEYIKNENTLEYLCNKFNATPEQIYKRLRILKLRGINYYPYITEECHILFDDEMEQPNSDTIIKVGTGMFSLVVSSDPHVGSIHDQIDRFKSLQDFIEYNNIHMLLNGGDLTDGPAHIGQSMERRLDDRYDQIDEFIKYYPYIDGANICVLGGPEHDTPSKRETDYSIYNAIRRDRPDIKVTGDATATIKVDNKEIILCHNIKDPNARTKLTDDRIILSGHSHYYSNNTVLNGAFGPAIKLVVPSMSNLPIENQNQPGFLKLTFTCNQDQVVVVTIDFYTFEGRGSNILKANTISYQLPYVTENKEKANNKKGRSRKK